MSAGMATGKRMTAPTAAMVNNGRRMYCQVQMPSSIKRQMMVAASFIGVLFNVRRFCCGGRARLQNLLRCRG